MKKIFLALIVIFFALSVFAQSQTDSSVIQKSTAILKGDKSYAAGDFEKAIKFYSEALANSEGDTVYILQQLGDAYTLVSNPEEAEKCYAKIADNPHANSNYIFRYAETLRWNLKFTEAKKYYSIYQQEVPENPYTANILSHFDDLKELSKDKGAYRINTMGFNSSANDFASAYVKDGKIFFVSDRKGKMNKNEIDNWNAKTFYRVYEVAPDSGTNETKLVKTMCGCMKKGKRHAGSAVFNTANNELIFAHTSPVKNSAGKKVLRSNLYSMPYPKGKGKIVSLPFNNTEFSNAQPALSADGNTLYFSSDRIGGQGGTDLYSVTRDKNGKWSEPNNLGNEINTAADEKYPFVGPDGTLYFSSNNVGGMGGLDVYKAKFENGKLQKPENIGTQINSSHDDFAFVMNSDNKHGYFSSNRTGGIGGADIYSFTFDATKLDYKVTVRVIDAGTKQPLNEATLALNCKSPNMENSITNEKGEQVFTLRGGKSCTVDVLKDGYQLGEAPITPKNKYGVVVIELKPDVIHFTLVLKEKESQQPVRDAAITLVNGDNAEMNYVTDISGTVMVTLPAAKYILSSSDIASVKDNFSESDADSSGNIKREYFIPRAELIVNVPLTANCFSSTVTITDLRTNESFEVKPNTDGVVRLDIRMNNRYLIAHNGRRDTISTVGLQPGDEIDGPCKFYVGQTWVMNNIYYDFNKWNIRKDAATELNHLAQVMKENPSLEVELGSHTDCRGSAKYNMTLSARRAKSAVDYIVKRGIKARRVLAAGYGESRLTNICVCEQKDDSKCVESQHQANRRTEVKVLKY